MVAIRPLDRKLLRDLWRMRGQAIAIALVALCGIATFVTMRGSYEALLTSQAVYYEHYRFADVFVNLKRAPDTLLDRVRNIPGVNEVEGRVVFDASLDVPGLNEPASGRLVSLPDRPGSGLNRVHIRTGRAIRPDDTNAVLVSEAFAEANALRPGDTIDAIINGRKERLHIVGIALSPEYISEIKGNTFPDNRRFGVLWMSHEALAAALDMKDAFNDLSLVLAPHASEAFVIRQLDALLAPYGSLGAYGRRDQISHQFLENELAQDRITSVVIPAIFLSVTAFLIHNTLLRLTTLQRAQIGLLKSFGYGNFAIGMHYLKFALLTVMAGGILGAILGVWLGNGLAIVYTRFFHFPRLHFSLSGFAIGLSLLIALLSAVVGATLAVARVLALPPAEAMRPESPALFKPGPLERLGLQRFMPLSVRMILRNMERSPIKAALSIVGLAFGVSLMITGQYTFDALDEIIRIQFRTAQRDDVTVTFNEARNSAVVYNLASLPGVMRAEPFRMMAARLRFGYRTKKTAIMGLGPSRQLRVILDEREHPIDLPQDGIILTARLAAILNIAAGDKLTVELLEGQRQVVSVPVTKIVDEPIGMFAYMDMRALARLAAQDITVSGAFLSVDPLRRDNLYRTLKSIPAVASVSLREATLQSFLATIAENLVISTTVLIAFACVIAVGIVYNSARIALSEHALELASLRILGFTQAEVGVMLLGEQTLLILAAIPVGCLLGYMLCALLSVLLSQDLFRIPLVVSTHTYLLSIGVTLAAATVSGYMIWRKVRHLDLIEVLKARE